MMQRGGGLMIILLWRVIMVKIWRVDAEEGGFDDNDAQEGDNDTQESIKYYWV